MKTTEASRADTVVIAVACTTIVIGVAIGVATAVSKTSRSTGGASFAMNATIAIGTCAVVSKVVVARTASV
jgi:hypothetical protein